ncbi:kelch-like protein 20 [Aplysia californica]|uniref:Kelch-like protein 20 n=1 Tax=Aplysia californica TaxID=6500 RepID=A0ABM0K952_APLCA|nr:kelch-like protein 20 [Aplysia californica]XP_005111836.1 kelch-like protein 20 [Aplysia californica]
MADSNTNTTPSSEASTQGEDVYCDKDRALNLLTGFSQLYKNKQFVDVTLVVEHTAFPCHKNVLAASSPYFLVMFSTSLAEAQQDQITLKDMEARTLALVLDYIYTGQVTLTEDTVQNLLSAANLFQLIPLRDGCAEFMMSHVTVANCIGVFFFAKAHQCNVLALKAKEIINNKFPQLCKQQEFLSLPVDKLVEIVSDDDLNVTMEETVYEACMHWLLQDRGARRQHLVQVMNCVRIANISSYYFCDKIDTDPLLKENTEMCSLLDTIRCYHMLKNRQQEMDVKLMPRRGMVYERGVMIIANPYTEDILKKYNSMEMLLPKTGEVIHICKLPHSLYTPGVASTGDNQIYLAGGAIRKINYRGTITTEGVSNQVYMFDQAEASWQPKAKMNMIRSQFSLVIVDGFLYAVGGQDGNEILMTVERYDPHTNTWTMVRSLPRCLRFTTGVSFRGKLYIFGGETKVDVSNNALRYDPTDDTWTELPPMKTPRVLAGSVVFKDKIYVIGGNSAISEKWRKEYLPEFCVTSVEIFDPVTEVWSEGPSLGNALCGAGVVKYGDSLLVVGGEDDKSWMAGVCKLCQDGEQDTWMWSEGQELPTVMSTFGCVVANIPHEVLKLQH